MHLDLEHNAIEGPNRPRAGGGREDGRSWEEMGSSSGSGRRVQTLPLNSRRLTVSVLRQLAGGLGVPPTAA